MAVLSRKRTYEYETHVRKWNLIVQSRPLFSPDCYTRARMLVRIRKLALYLLLACLPLQSVAGPAHLLLHDNAAPAAADGLHVDDDGDEHPAHDGAIDQGVNASHDCYQNYFSGVMHGTSQLAGPTGIVYVPAEPAGFDSFFPERLKRPPLTAPAA